MNYILSAMCRLLTQGHNAWPNNYTFTKAISEELVRERQDRLPIAIVRPGVGMYVI